MDTTDPVISIGTVAEKLGASVSTIRKYESDGLIIPHRTDSGHRLFSMEDIDRLRAIQQMIQERGLNVEGIRRLQAMIPCWELLPCKLKKWDQCPAFTDNEKPCWIVKGLDCAEQGNECRQCKVYRFGSLHIDDVKKVVYREDCGKEIRDRIEGLLEPDKQA